jgi:hypothetical protein
MRSFNRTSNKVGQANNAAVSCIGKVGLDSYERAAQVLKRNATKAPSGRSAYHCTHCQKWHIGTDGGVNKKQTAQLRKRKSHD